MTTASSSSYVCAFRGRRDNYEVPLALAEAGKLDQFITDAYLTARVERVSSVLPATLRERFASRHDTAIPDDRVRCLWGTTVLENVRHALGAPERNTYAELDHRYSIAARDRARKTKSNLLLYHPYAWEAFTARYSHQPRRVLFQFHPHADLEDRLLKNDQRLHPESWSSSDADQRQSASGQDARRERDCWRHADLIICASSFTKKSLVEVGADPAMCHVIPYGIKAPQMPESEIPPDRFEVLFVGSGVRRKGLHHLLRAWETAKLPKASRLTLVCRDSEAWLEKRVQKSEGVRLIRGIDARGLSELYRTSTLFAMPSLVEGFGHVYLEALAVGCPVLGTSHTGLPDLGIEDDGIFLTAAGELEPLVHDLERLAEKLIGNIDMRHRARACAARFPSSRFRKALLETLQMAGEGEETSHLQGASLSRP